MRAITARVSYQRLAVDTALFAGLLAVSVFTPAFVMSQFVTGTIINAVLLIAAVRLGPWPAVGIGAIPSTIALASGQLPAALAPMVPFIILANAVMVVIFHHLRKSNYMAGLLPAAGLKFAYLFAAASILAAKGVLAGPVAAMAVVVFGWPQLVTALAGGAVAYGALKTARQL